MIDKVLSFTALVLAIVVEPLCHALAIPHPEGLAQACVNQLAVRQSW